jgi:Inhibitor of Apoptosis domain
MLRMTNLSRLFGGSDSGHRTKEVDYANLKHRIESFKMWPVPWLDPVKLALNGFYYPTNPAHMDLVTCHQCKLSLYDWEADDIPEIEHFLWSPTCRYGFYNPPRSSNEKAEKYDDVASNRSYGPIDETPYWLHGDITTDYPRQPGREGYEGRRSESLKRYFQDVMRSHK